MVTNSDLLALGLEHHEGGRLPEAEQIYRQILTVDPEHMDALHLLGVVAHEVGQQDLAIDLIQRAIALHEANGMFHNNLGEAYRALGRITEAIACYERALELKPNFPEAHNNLGAALQELGNLDEATACFERAVQLNPDYANAHYNLAFTWLLAGDWERGLAEYEWRWRRVEVAPRNFPQPRWNGEPLAGRTILLHAEQGLGDTIQFVRYLPLVAAQGGHVVLVCQTALLPLLSQLSGVDHLVASGTLLPEFDTHAPLLSLPLIFGTTPQTIPASAAYLDAEPALVQRWRAELSSYTGFKIGIAWQGNASFPRDRTRSVPLRCFEPLARVPGVQLFSLQKGPGTEQLAAIRGRFKVFDWSDRLDVNTGPFLDTAALIKSLDLVVSSDTSVAHLAGALGAPVWLATSQDPDWRWLLAREDSPWYPTMRLFRQAASDGWAGVFQRMAVALRERLTLNAK